MGKLFEWRPTDRLIRGKLIKPFLPIKRYPQLSLENEHFKNLYHGDELYIFEQTTDEKWCRAYLVLQPLPEDFVTLMHYHSGNLPDGRFSMVVCPKKFIHLFLDEKVPVISFFKLPDAVEGKKYIHNNDVPTLHDVIDSVNSEKAKSLRRIKNEKPMRPPFPYFKLHDKSITEEVYAVLSLLCSHIYSMYTSGDFEIYDWLMRLYYQLDDVRLTLENNLVTLEERNQLVGQVIALTTKIARYLSTKGANKFERTNSSTVDPTGYDSILTRDLSTGNFLTYNDSDPHLVASSTMLNALAPNFPISYQADCQLETEKNAKFTSVEPSQLLVDFKDVMAAPEFQKDFTKLSAYMYLRTAKNRLTEPFVVQVNSDNILSLESISATLFNNIPASEIDNSRIYLVVELVETLELELLEIVRADEMTTKTVTVSSPTDQRITQLRKGIAVGVADISRVFARGKKSYSDEAFHYKVSLFGSYFKQKINNDNLQRPSTVYSELDNATPNTSQDIGKVIKNMNNSENNGWGELVDRIIADSDKGIAVDPRAQSLTVTVKEIKDSTARIFDTDKFSAIKCVPPYFYDTLSEPVDRIYLTLGKVRFCDPSTDFNFDNITISVSAANKNIVFRNGFNESPTSCWQFISVKPDESVGETIRVDGIPAMDKDETLRVSACCGTLLAKAKFYIKKGNQILEYKKNSSFQLMSAQNKPLIEVEIGTEYVGQTFNMERSIYNILSLWRRSPSGEVSGDEETEESLTMKIMALKNVSTIQLVKYFDSLLVRYLELNYAILQTERQKSSSAFKDTILYSLVYFLDKVVVLQDSYKHLFHDFIEKFSRLGNNLPPVGPVLLDAMANQLSSADVNWNYVGRACCRTHALVVQLCLITSRDAIEELKLSLKSYFNGLSRFFAYNKDSALMDQMKILEDFDIVIDSVKDYFTADELLGFCSSLFSMCHEKELALGISKNPLNTKEQKFINKKFLLLRRLLEHDPVKGYLFAADQESEYALSFINKAIEWSLQPLMKKKLKYLDVNSIRVANGVIVSILKYAKNTRLRKNLTRLIPTFCRFFISLYKYSEEFEQLKFSRTFTSLFPTSIPLNKITTDSIVKEEVTSEPLIELATILTWAIRHAEGVYGEAPSFIEITNDCKEDKIFNSAFYISSFTKEDIMSAINTVDLMTNGTYFPSKRWLSMTAMFVRSSVTLLHLYKDILIRYNLPPPGASFDKFDTNLWSSYLKRILELGNHRVCSLVSLSESPRKAVYMMTGDIRSRIAWILEDCWQATAEGVTDDRNLKRFGVHNVGGFQVLLFRDNEDVVREFLTFAFQWHSEARRVCAWLTWAICINVWNIHHTLTIAGQQTVSVLYTTCQTGRIMTTKHGLVSFFSFLMHTVHINRDDEALDDVIDYVSSMYTMMNIVSDMQDLPMSEEFGDLRTASQLSIFGYLMAANKPEAFHTLINDFFLRSVKKKDYAQAALSLELLADTYKWIPNDVLPAIQKPPLPKQSSFERKEYLCKEAARNFAKGSKLEKALTIYKDLAEAYETINYDLNGLAYVHEQIANLYTDLQNIDRLVPSYFKVTFIGYGFPASIRGKVFVFEGLPFEHITSIQTRMMKMYPGTKIVQSQEECDQLLLDMPAVKRLHVIAVEPKFKISEDYRVAGKKFHVDNKIRIWIENTDLKTFCHSKRLPGATSVTNLWVREFTYQTVSTFPTLLNRSEVCSVTERDLSPIENAIKSLEVKIQDLIGLENVCYKLIKESGDCNELFAELSRELNGTIDAPVNGGIAQYRAFCKLELDEHLSASQVEQLKSLFDDLAIVLNRCLALHFELCPPGFMKSFDMMCEQFERNFEDEIKRNNIDVQRYTNDILDSLKSVSFGHPFNKNRSTTPQSSLVTIERSSGSSNYSSKGSSYKASPYKNSLSNTTMMIPRI
ncbi:guanine nucleotide exchange factor DCK1 Ecym_7016 [Eremothecium cymbalariae DBVPG|uniref:DOCKER domain-containing protein n=1 Tax=Eremothecium cymbalariae (strain CBS 270.75 / DBVPG 7215 / KCTC 17166 / NRRL Y-17582) TaxID=931890 RepID=G8JVK8_ERECY|nr:hypothetical protein Ecym_7016 [Eremothecium cymbalariae DBVPG\